MSVLTRLVDFIKWHFYYKRKWIKSKPCCVCKYFDYYMGSAGVCTAKSGCPAKRMRDYSDVCDCNCFRESR